jgi:hypothetical protein
MITSHQSNHKNRQRRIQTWDPPAASTASVCVANINTRVREVPVRVARFLLGKGYHIELPLCVTGDIRDAFPAKGGNYTGFKKGFLN